MSIFPDIESLLNYAFITSPLIGVRFANSGGASTASMDKWARLTRFLILSTIVQMHSRHNKHSRPNNKRDKCLHGEDPEVVNHLNILPLGLMDYGWYKFSNERFPAYSHIHYPKIARMLPSHFLILIWTLLKVDAMPPTTRASWSLSGMREIFI